MDALTIAAAVAGGLWYILLAVVTARWLHESVPAPLGEKLPPWAGFSVVLICVLPITVPVFLMMCAATGLKLIKTKLF